MWRRKKKKGEREIEERGWRWRRGEKGRLGFGGEAEAAGCFIGGERR